MLTVEEMEKINNLFDLEGFYKVEIFNKNEYLIKTNNDLSARVINNSLFDGYMSVYDLFLRRVREVIDYAYWNDEFPYQFSIRDMEIEVFHKSDLDNSILTVKDTIEGLEQAIKYILKQLEGNNG